MRITSLVLNVFGSMIRLTGYIILIIFLHENHLVLGLSITGIITLIISLVPTYTSLMLRAKIPLWFIFDFLFVSFLGGIFYFTWIPKMINEPVKIIDESKHLYKVGDQITLSQSSKMYPNVKDQVGSIVSLEDDGKYYIKFDKYSFSVKECDIIKQ